MAMRLGEDEVNGTREEDAARGRSSPTLSWKDFFGSSVELAPSVMTVFDSYVTSSQEEESSPSVCEVCPVQASSDPSPKSAPEDAQDHLRDHPNVSLASRDSGYISNSERSHVTANGFKDHHRKLLRQGAIVPGMETHTLPHSHLKASGIGVTSAGHAPGSGETKKRPLSIASTSSSASSTSSLPRHQKKKTLTASVASACLSAKSPTNPPVHMYEEVEEFAVQNSSEGSNKEYHTDSDSKSSSLDRDNDSSVVFSQVTSGRSSGDGIAVEIGEPSEYTHENNLHRDNGLSHIEKVVEEITLTERTYVSDLKDIIQGYLYPITQHAAELRITTNQLDALFSNIKDIYAFNSVLLAQLEECHLNPVQVAQCFVAQTKGFVIYSEYCTNYPRCVEVLTECMRCPATADVFKQQQLALHHGLPLGSYLLKPVQRVLKYHLLLQNLLRDFEEYDEEGRGYVEEALESMTCMAQHINDMKRQHEHLMRVQEIQCLLYGWDGADLTTFGDLVLEDSFRMHGVKGRRHLLLFKKGLLMTKNKEDGNMLVKDSIMCANLMLVESIPKDPLSFHLIPFNNPRIQHTVQARNLEQKHTWCQELKQLILDNYSAVIPEKAKALVMQLGKSREEEEYEETRLDDAPKKQHSAPEYLQRRRGRRRSTSIVPDFGLLKSRRSSKKVEHSSPKSSPQMQRKVFAAEKKSMVSPSSAPVLIHSDLSPLETEIQVARYGQKPRGRSVSTSTPPSSLPIELSHGATNNGQLHVMDNLSPIEEAQDQVDSPQVTCRPEKTYDDTSRRASRLSQVLDEEGLSQQLLDSPEKGLHWDQNIVTSVLSVPAVRRAESFRLATRRGSELSDDVPTLNYVRRRSLTEAEQCGEDDDCHMAVVFNGNNYEIKQKFTATSSRGNYANVVSANITGDIPFIDDSLDDYVQMTHPLKGWRPSANASNATQSGISGEFSPSQKCSSPVRTTAYINKDLQLSHKDVPCHTDCHEFSPWVLRSSQETKATSTPPQTSRHSASSVCYDSQQSSHRSNTCNVAEGGPHSMLHKCLSFENVVFRDRKAYLRWGSPPSIRRCMSLDNQLARLCTPPRELGPADVIKEVHQGVCRGKIINCYGTQPRIPDCVAHADALGRNCEDSDLVFDGCCTRDNNQAPLHVNADRHLSGSTSSETSPSQLDSSFFLPLTPNSPSSPHGHLSGMFSPHVTSPSSMASTDSLVGSFKQAVASLTGKITGKSSHGGSHSPRRTPRARSANALDELRIDQSLGIDPRLQGIDPTTKKKKKRNQLVHQLARAYSDRVKNRTFKISFVKHRDGKSKGGSKSCRLNKEDNQYETEVAAVNKCPNAKLEESTPIILGSYSLTGLRPPRPKPSHKPRPVAQCIVAEHCVDTVELCDQVSEDTNVDKGTHEQTSESDVSQSPASETVAVGSLVPSQFKSEAVQIPVEHYFTVSAAGDGIEDDDDSDTDESIVDEYYEQKFVEDLERNLQEGNQLLCPDKGRLGARASSAEHVACLRESIKDTVKVIEQKYNAHGGLNHKVEVTTAEKGTGVRKILHHLEQGDSAAIQTHWEAIFPNRPPYRTIKDRRRELVECATLTRIRQGSCIVGEEMAVTKATRSAEDEGANENRPVSLGNKGVSC